MAPNERPSVLIVDGEPGSIRLSAGILRGERGLCFATSGAGALPVARLVAGDAGMIQMGRA